MRLGIKLLITAVGVIICFLILVACGGGGGGGGGSSSGTTPVDVSFAIDDLIGAYRVGHIEFDPALKTAMFDNICDGNGNYVNSMIHPGSGTDTGIYALAPDGTLTIDSQMHGQLSIDGNVFSLVDTDLSDNKVSFSIGLKQGTGLEAADMLGYYHVFAVLAQDYDLCVMRFSYTFDGIDNVVSLSLSQPGNDDEFEYTVSDDGMLTLYDPLRDSYHYGHVSPDCEIFFVVDRSILLIGVKSTTFGGVTNADLSGTFHGIAIEDTFFADGDDSFSSLNTSRLTVQADGSDEVTVSLIETSKTGPVATGIQETVDIASNGTMDMTRQFVGQLSSDSGMFVVADDPVGDASSTILFCIIKP